MDRTLAELLLDIRSTRLAFQAELKMNAEWRDPSSLPEGLFPGQDDHPRPFVPRSMLVIPLFDGDRGSRPVELRGLRTPGVVLRGSDGREVRTLRAGETIIVEGRVLNLGNADAPATTVEAFVGYRRMVEHTVQVEVPPDEMRIRHIYSISDQGTVVSGFVFSGRFRQGDVVTLPDGRTTVVVRVMRRAGISLLLRGIGRDEVRRGQIVRGRPARTETVTQREIIDDPETVEGLTFLGVAYADVACERAATVTIPWTVSAPPDGASILSATIYLRAYGYMPADLPGNLDALDHKTSRHVGRTVLKTDFR